MLKKPKNKQKSVAEKVAEHILHPNQSDSDSDTADEATAPKVIEYDDEYELPSTQPTEFRKQSVKLLSEQSDKYKGKIVCRKDFESDESDNKEDFDTSDDDETFTALKGCDKEIAKDSEELKEDNEQESENSGDSEDSKSDIDSEDEEEENEVVSKINHEAEIQKGFCVQNQLRIWERLLELRIHLQKVLNKTNQLPSQQELKDIENHNNYKEIKESTCKQTCLLLQNLLSLKNNLSTQFSEVEKNMKTSLKRPLPFNEKALGEPQLKQVNLYLQDCFKQFNTYRNDVLLKWDDRTKLLQPGAGSKKKNFNEEYDIIKKIENASINKTFLIEKSRQLKTGTENDSLQESKRNPDIYDDSDFYHQQLRELIEYKANTTSNTGEVTKQFLELQKLRQKMKKQVDTRASKGRKLRYIVHNKLVNFMAPHDNYTYTMESIDELSKSLFT